MNEEAMVTISVKCTRCGSYTTSGLGDIAEASLFLKSLKQNARGYLCVACREKLDDLIKRLKQQREIEIIDFYNGG